MGFNYDYNVNVNLNKELLQQSITPKGKPKAKKSSIVNVFNGNIKEPTEKPKAENPTKAAGTSEIEDAYKSMVKIIDRNRKKFNKHKASNGMSYGKAKGIVKTMMEKYKGNGKMSAIMSHKYEADENGRNGKVHHYVDPEKLPEPDKSIFIKAMAAMKEIEEKYPDEYELTLPNTTLLEGAARGQIYTVEL